MNNSVSKQIEKAISNAGNCRDALNIAIARESVLRTAYLNLQDEIAELEAENQRLREVNRWTPVGERLPEKEGSYLVSYYGVKFTSDGYFNGKRFSGESRIVSAWRELPEPYQEDL